MSCKQNVQGLPCCLSMDFFALNSGFGNVGVSDGNFGFGFCTCKLKKKNYKNTIYSDHNC